MTEAPLPQPLEPISKPDAPKSDEPPVALANPAAHASLANQPVSYRETWLFRVEMAQGIFSLCLVGATVASILIAYWQFHEAKLQRQSMAAQNELVRDQYRVMLEQNAMMKESIRLTTESNKAAAQSANAAEDSAVAAKQSVDGSNDTARKQLRAYVMVDTIELVDPGAFLKALGLAPAGPLRVRVQINVKNMGQTPASNVVATSSIRVANSTDSFDTASKNDLARAQSPLQRSEFSSGPGHTFQHSPSIDLTPEQRESLQSGQSTLWVFGEIRYTDIYGEKRRTRFRQLATGDPTDPTSPSALYLLTLETRLIDPLLSNPPPFMSKRKKPPKRRQNDRRKHQQQVQAARFQSSPTASSNIDAVANEPRMTKQSAEKAKPALTTEKIERYQLWFNGIIAATTIISAGITWGQLSTMRSQSDLMKVQVDQMESQNKTAAATLQQMAEDRRSWLLVDELKFEVPPTPKEVVFKVRVTNYGDTPSTPLGLASTWRQMFPGPDGVGAWGRFTHEEVIREVTKNGTPWLGTTTIIAPGKSHEFRSYIVDGPGEERFALMFGPEAKDQAALFLRLSYASADGQQRSTTCSYYHDNRSKEMVASPVLNIME